MDTIIKQSHINTINLLYEKLGFDPLPYHKLSKLSVGQLEEIRDNLVIEYNKSLEGL